MEERENEPLVELAEAMEVTKEKLMDFAAAAQNAKEVELRARRAARRAVIEEKRAKRQVHSREMSALKLARAKVVKAKRKRTRK